MAKKNKKNKKNANKRREKKKQNKAVKRKKLANKSTTTRVSAESSEQRRPASPSPSFPASRLSKPPVSTDDQYYSRSFGDSDPKHLTSQVVQKNEVFVPFTPEWCLMFPHLPYNGPGLEELRVPNASAPLRIQRKTIDAALKNLSLCLNVMIQRFSGIPESQAKSYRTMLVDTSKSEGIDPATRSFAAAKLTELGESGFESMIDDQFPLSENNTKLPGYPDFKSLDSIIYSHLGLIHYVAYHLYRWHPQSPELTSLYNLMIRSPVLYTNTLAAVAAKLITWGLADDATLQIVDELESDPDPDSQLYTIFDQDNLTQQNGKLWASDRVRKSKSHLVRMIGLTTELKLDNTPVDILEQMKSNWDSMTDPQKIRYFEIIFEPPETEVFHKFALYICDCPENKEVFEAGKRLWEFCDLEPSDKLLKLYGWS